MPAVLTLAHSYTWCLALIKPQFEIGRGKVGKRGIVKDEAIFSLVTSSVEDWFTNFMGWRVLGIVPSPIKGQKGNSEFLIAAMASDQT